jgi:hypothetical protein
MWVFYFKMLKDGVLAIIGDLKITDTLVGLKALGERSGRSLIHRKNSEVSTTAFLR